MTGECYQWGGGATLLFSHHIILFSYYFHYLPSYFNALLRTLEPLRFVSKFGGGATNLRGGKRWWKRYRGDDIESHAQKNHRLYIGKKMQLTFDSNIVLLRIIFKPEQEGETAEGLTCSYFHRFTYHFREVAHNSCTLFLKFRKFDRLHENHGQRLGWYYHEI